MACPGCATALTWRDRQAVDGVRFDYFGPCPRRCGEFVFDHLRRRFQRLHRG